MHRCLTIAEILQHIFEHIPVSRNLVNLAAVCHAFSEPALEILWQDVSLWTLVVYTVPTSVLDVSEITNALDNGSTTVKRVARMVCPPRPEEMDRFIYYASFIRSLHVSGNYWKGKYKHPMVLDSSIFDALVFLQRPQLTLPNLRSLSISSLPAWMCGRLDIFLVPSIRKLVYGSITSNDQTCIPFMAQMRRSCAQVEILQLKNLSDSQEVLKGVHKFIGSFSNIRQLDYLHTWPDGAILHLLAQMPALEDLKYYMMGHGSATQAFGPRLPHAFRCFPSLKTLRVQSNKLSHIELLLTMVQSAPLEQLILTRCSPHAEAQWSNEHRVFRTLTVLRLTSRWSDISVTFLARMSLPCLEELHINSTDSLGDSISTVSATCSLSSLRCLHIHRACTPTGLTIPIDSVIRPLLAFYRIEHLRLSSRHTFEISDKTLEEFASSWPHLKHIYLGSDADKNASSVTLKGIASLAFHCTGLEHIALPVVNITRAPTIEGLGCQNTHRNSNVKEIDFGPTAVPAECIEEVASVLSQIFPTLRKFRTKASTFALNLQPSDPPSLI
ncbi:RNI-like protein [Heliocybe sulcata]|uniref:RNI-like protein n=1 Tax=Heliocybe sulcata TaxID=5364 RepID=A0A5C3N6K0_9AGAM|nr:RNI-like protein [Heliocybe sulcata]